MIWGCVYYLFYTKKIFAKKKIFSLLSPRTGTALVPVRYYYTRFQPNRTCTEEKHRDDEEKRRAEEDDGGGDR